MHNFLKQALIWARNGRAFLPDEPSGPGTSAGLTHKRTMRALRAPSCKGAPSKTGWKL